MKLLLAEDERDLSSAIKKVLVFSKYDVDCVYDGVEAMEKISYNTYDALILDIMMPRMDGLTVVKKLREEGNNIPVLILTARAETDDKVLGLDYGADDYLTKPFQIKELLARIRALLRRKGDILETCKYGDLVLDQNTYELKCKKTVRLTSKEYKMMDCLIRNKDSLLSTESLMEKIWDFDSEAEINVVWAYISSLRKKMEQIGSCYTIKAVRGVGYQLGKKDD